MELKIDSFKIYSLFNSSLSDYELETFSVKHKKGLGLVYYLQTYAHIEEENNLMRTYIVRDAITNELVGYFSLKAGMVSINEKIINDNVTFETRPGVELANYAINNTYMKKHLYMKGTGLIIFNDLIYPIVKEVSKIIGIKLLYIFSLPVGSLINRYEQYGFKRLSPKREDELHKRLKPQYDKGCIFMYQEI